MKINVRLHPPCDQTHSSLQIWDFYHAYRQYLNRDHDYHNDVIIDIGQDVSPEKDAINVGWYYMPDVLEDPERYDLIIVDGQQHHLEVSTGCMFRAIKSRPNCYYVSGSYVDASHPFHHKILWTPMVFNNTDYLVRPFYPQYHERKHIRESSRNGIIYINGQNRPHRQYFMDQLSLHAPAVEIRNNLHGSIYKLLDSFFETPHDTKFRKMVNRTIPWVEQGEKSDYYDKSILAGPGGKFGPIPPGYFMMDEYYQYHSVMFPETPWLNDEIFITEKIIKCFVAGSIPWPIGGANTHALYNQIGYGTAWNLLPDVLKSFDQEPDHAKRYQMQAQAAAWAAEHPEIWTSETAKKLAQDNHDRFFSSTHDGHNVIRLHQILESVKK